MDPSQAKLYNSIILTCLVLGAILVFFIISLIRHQRSNNKLYIAKIQAEVSTMENERTRIARDLHDELGPLLSAIRFKLSSVESKTTEDDSIINEASDHIADIIHRLRNISNDLMPTTLLRKGLASAIEEFIYKITDSIPNREQPMNLAINFRSDQLPVLEKEIAVNIYRMVQEIIHNTIRHAGASILNIDLETGENKIILSTQDNGVGFNYISAMNDNSGLGLRNLVSRSDIMKGDFFIDSNIGKGTTYTIEIPIT